MEEVEQENKLVGPVTVIGKLAPPIPPPPALIEVSPMKKSALQLFEDYEYRANLVKISKSGKVYLPKLVRELFNNCKFRIIVENGCIVLRLIFEDDKERSKEVDE